jgi:hypothetical protein
MPLVIGLTGGLAASNLVAGTKVKMIGIPERNSRCVVGRPVIAGNYVLELGQVRIAAVQNIIARCSA